MKKVLLLSLLLVSFIGYAQDKEKEKGIILHGDSTFTAPMPMLERHRLLQIEVDGCRKREASIVQKGSLADKRESELNIRQEAIKGEEKKLRNQRLANTLSKIVAIASTFGLAYVTIVK
jgi:hypothetical protein